MPALGELLPAWEAAILGQLAIKVRSKWRGGRWVDPGDGAVRFAVDNEWHQRACEETRREVEVALSAHFGRPVAVAVVVDGGAAPAGGPTGRSGPGRAATTVPGHDEDEHIDPSELRDAGDVATGGVDLLMREFGGQLVEEER